MTTATSTKSGNATTHQAFVAVDRNAFSFANATGEFSVGDYAGLILETLDSVETQVSHRYQARVTTPHGGLSTHSYDSVPGLLSLVGPFTPAANRLGVVPYLDDGCAFTTAPLVAMEVDQISVIEITPTCRVLALPGNHADDDHVPDMLSSLEADWQS